MAIFITSEGPWGATSGRRKPFPSELPEWQMVPPEERVVERMSPKDDIRAAIDIARELPIGAPMPASLQQWRGPSIEQRKLTTKEDGMLIGPDGRRATYLL